MRQSTRHNRRSALAGILLLAGCASQGPTRPPSLNLPAAVRGLSAQRIGNTVDLTWTNPTRTTDGVSLTAKHGAGAMRAEICRAESFPAQTCTPIARIPAISGTPGSFHDVLPPALAEGALRSLAYRVRLVNSADRGAAWTEEKTAAGSAPPPVADLRAYPVANGILIRWQRQPSAEGDVMLRVFRGAEKDSRGTLLDSQSASGPSAEAASGAIDTGGHAGQEQRYIVFRRRTLTLQGQSFTLDSAPATVTVAATAQLPLPQPPTGLEAVANTLSTPEADLVWQPPADPTITGYRVYREESGAANLITQEPVHGFSYADKAVQPGHAYRYIVASVNATGESRSTPVIVTIP